MRRLLTLAFVLVAGVFLAGWWMWRVQSLAVVDPEVPRRSIGATLTNAVERVKKQVTGGIGVMITAEPTTGQLTVRRVMHASPADHAGLQVGDVIVQVNGQAVTNQPLAQVVDQIRGFTGASVTLTVQRPGPTNFQCIIKRSSWNALQITQPKPVFE